MLRCHQCEGVKTSKAKILPEKSVHNFSVIMTKVKITIKICELNDGTKSRHVYLATLNDKVMRIQGV